ncbi:MAG: hypothetical protein LBF25_02510 [Puniceicoccales bacterium]|jgi:hypothetical protein|nr:hypothetical protein [Puniceicoccales bacterium]
MELPHNQLNANVFSDILLAQKGSFEDTESFEKFCGLVYKWLDGHFQKKEDRRAFLEKVKGSIEIAKFIYQLPKDVPVKVSEIRSKFSSKKLQNAVISELKIQGMLI